MEGKTKIKILVVTDIHDDLEKIKKLVVKYKDTKFNYVFCCGDVIDVPINQNDNKEITDKYDKILKSIFLELGKLAPIFWVPGNHEPGHYFQNDQNSLDKEVTDNSFNLHKKIKKLDEKLYILGIGGGLPIMTGHDFNKDFIIFKDLDLKKDFKYKGYPYNVGVDYEDSDKIFMKDLNETFEKVIKEGGKDSQIIYLSHLGPLYTHTNHIVEGGEVLYLGSKLFGEKYLQENNSFVIIHGHSHNGEGLITLRKNKQIVNPGALILNGNHGIIEFEKSKDGKWGITSFTMSQL